MVTVSLSTSPLGFFFYRLCNRSRDSCTGCKEKKRNPTRFVHCAILKKTINGISCLHTCRSRSGKLDSSVNRKKSKENKEHDANRKEQRESIANRTQKCNPNPNPRGERARGLPGPRVTAAAGARDAFAPPLAGHLGTEMPPTCRSGTPGSRMRGSRAWLRPRPARRRLAHPLANARAGEQASAAPSRPLRLAVASTPWLPPLTRREKGGRMT